MEKIYKYFSCDVFDLVFQREGFCGVKCSLPKDYNDPYELFLGVDFNVSGDVLAVYQEIVRELPQFPTTCFSKSPVVVPMWAHYADNHSGFALEFDVAGLKRTFEHASFREVQYKDAPDAEISNALNRAAYAKKPRHAVWLQQTVFFEAYFSKQTAWIYEQECRLTHLDSYIENVAGSKILYIPLDCLSAIIVGRKFPEDRLKKSKDLAKAGHLDWFKLAIGRSQPMPFLISDKEEAFLFNGQGISAAENICDSCSEPVLEGKEQCPWCSITESDASEAASNNPFRILDHAGLLDEYFEEVGKLNSRKR